MKAAVITFVIYLSLYSWPLDRVRVPGQVRAHGWNEQKNLFSVLHRDDKIRLDAPFDGSVTNQRLSDFFGCAWAKLLMDQKGFAKVLFDY
jgi:hypothetical protein